MYGQSVLKHMIETLSAQLVQGFNWKQRIHWSNQQLSADGFWETGVFGSRAGNSHAGNKIVSQHSPVGGDGQ